MFTEYGESLQLQFFREFYAELLAAKRTAKEQATSPASPPRSSSVSKAPALLKPEVLKQRLVAMLQQHERTAAKIGGYFLEPYSDSRFAMVGLADEILINTEWKYNEWWKTDLLEMSVFGSYEAGESFYRRADHLLAERRSAENTESAKIYLLCLLLGFRGKYRYEGGESFCQKYIERLYEYVFDKPYNVSTDISSLTTDEDLHLRSYSEVKYFAPLHRRYLWLLGFLGLFVLATTILWFVITSPIRATLQEIYQIQSVVHTPQAEAKPVATSPTLEIIATNETGTRINATITVQDSSGFTTVANGSVGTKNTLFLGNLPKNTTLRVIVESLVHYPEVVWVKTQENDTLRKSIEMKSIESLVGKPISLTYISFGSSSAELMESSFSYLDRVANAIRSRPDVHLTISGHTDKSGLAASNMKLSRARAESVLTYLVRRGVPMEKLVAEGKGDTKPVSENETEAGRARNRRVEIVFGK